MELEKVHFSASRIAVMRFSGASAQRLDEGNRLEIRSLPGEPRAGTPHGGRARQSPRNEQVTRQKMDADPGLLKATYHIPVGWLGRQGASLLSGVGNRCFPGLRTLTG